MKDSLFDQAMREARLGLMRLAEAASGDPALNRDFSNARLAEATDALDQLDASYGRDVSVTSEAQSQ